MGSGNQGGEGRVGTAEHAGLHRGFDGSGQDGQVADHNGHATTARAGGPGASVTTPLGHTFQRSHITTHVSALAPHKIAAANLLSLFRDALSLGDTPS